MIDESRIRNEFRAILEKYKQKSPYFSGLMGDHAGDVETPVPNYSYVRIEDAVLVVFNNRVPNTLDIPVIVGYEDEHPHLFQVLGYDYDRMTAAEGADEDIPQMAAHHQTHEWLGSGGGGGTDVVLTQLRQMMPLRVVRTGTALNVQVDAGVAPTAKGQFLNVPVTEYDLASYVPAQVDHSRWVVFATGLNGYIELNQSAEISDTLFSLFDIPYSEVGYCPLAAVKLAYGQTSITEDATTTDIIDLRFPQSTKAYAAFQGVGALEGEIDFMISKMMLWIDRNNRNLGATTGDWDMTISTHIMIGH